MTPRVTLLGGGMIARDQILPSLYQLQRNGMIGEVAVCARRRETLETLSGAPEIANAFPGRRFDYALEPYADVIAAMPPRNLVVVALPDQLHFDAVMTAIRHDQHVICVKPLVLRAAESVEIERIADERGVFVGIEYHKRLDDRSLMARKRYREGRFGEFRLGTAALMEKWHYRHSNFQNWCTVENSDAFTYIGCHYVDLVHFITGLLPASVSVYGLRDRYPNGAEGFLWTDARIVWSNGACLNVQNSLSYPDRGPGPNMQGLTMWCSGADAGGMLRHSDQYRGLEYAFVDAPYSEPSPDYFQYVELGVVGYGYRSLEYLLRCVLRVQGAAEPRAESRAIAAEAIVATPGNSRYNELVVEAGRLSILNGAREARIDYGQNRVELV